MNKKKLLSLALALVMTLSLAAPAMAAEDGAVKILYTNDVHAYIDNTRTVGEGDAAVDVPGLRYSTVAAYKKASGADFLVDAGDHIQGDVYGKYDEGETIIKLMNAAGYTASTLGNHEFDYSMTRTLELVGMAEYDYVSCNIYNTETNEQLLDSYKVYTAANGKKVAFVGFTTPESITKSTPKYFMNEAGQIVWSFSAEEAGAELYATAQAAIDAAAKEADYVIGVGHMGVDAGSAPYTSEDIIANTTGLTAFIDGHSHTTMEMQEVANKNGEKIILTQTGCYLAALGEMTIAADGTVTTRLLSDEDLADVTPDAAVAKIEDDLIKAVDDELGAVIGVTEVDLSITDANGIRVVRKQESTIANFCADAMLWYFSEAGYDADVALVQGGGVRASLSGEISSRDMQAVFPWGNALSLKEVTGQQLLDALEHGVRFANIDSTEECGGFLNVAGARFKLNVGIPSTVQYETETGLWEGAPTGAYRVTDLEIKDRATGEYVPVDLTKTYLVGSTTYIMDNDGDGMTMFREGTIKGQDLAIDYEALADYLKTFPVDESTGLPTIKAGMGYDDVEGRIVIVNRPADLDKNEWWYGSVCEVLDSKLMKGTNKGFEPNAMVTKASVLQTLYNAQGNPAVESVLTDVEGKWWANAANWAAANGLIQGTQFGDDSAILRGEIKDLLEAYGKLIGVDYSDLLQGNEHGDLMLEETVTRAQYAQIMLYMLITPPVPLA